MQGFVVSARAPHGGQRCRSQLAFNAPRVLTSKRMAKRPWLDPGGDACEEPDQPSDASGAQPARGLSALAREAPLHALENRDGRGGHGDVGTRDARFQPSHVHLELAGATESTALAA